MSVLSKALRFAVLVTVLGGCSTGSPSSNLESAETKDGMSDSSKILAGDQSAVNDTAAPESGVAGTQSAAAPGMSEVNKPSVELAALETKDGSQLTVNRDGTDSFSIAADGGMAGYSVTTLNSPPRIVVDLKGVTAGSNRAFNISDSSSINGIRIGAQKSGTRVVFDLRDPSLLAMAEKSVSQDGDRIVIALQSSQIEAGASPTLPTPEPEKVAANPAPLEDTIMTEAPPVQAEAAPVDGTTKVKAIVLKKTDNSPGTVSIGLDRVSPFELQQTAPSEYVLTLAGAESDPSTHLPQIASGGAKGLRSARAVQDGDTVRIRMFVDPATTLTAKTDGTIINITASAEQAQLGADARGQLAAPEAAAPAEQVKEEPANASAATVQSIYGRKTYTGRLISLDLQDTDIDNALRIIAEVSNLNIIASDDVTGKVTLRLIDVPWDQALDVILKTNGLDQVEEGNVIRIAPVEKLRQEREALKEAEDAARALEALTVKYIRVSYARVTDIKEQVESVISERGNVAVDERTNQLIIKDISQGHQEAAELIKKLDLRTPQVLLETQIVEGQRTILRDLGFQWNYSYIQSPETGNATGLVFPNSIAIGGTEQGAAGNDWAVNFPGINTGSSIGIHLDSSDGSRSLTARLSAFEQERKVSIISRPQVATVNNKQAEIKSVETVRVRLPDSGTAVSTGSGAQASAGGSTAFEQIEVGIDLLVTPQASPDYFVLLDVDAKSSTFGGREVDGIPSTVDRSATSTILVKSGQTFALGGVYRLEDQDSVEGVPWLKDLPFLGHMFRRDLTAKSDEELIFFITPHIVEGSFSESLMQQP